MWVFIAMFAIPEILFSSIFLSVANLMGTNFNTLSSIFINDKIFSDKPIYLLIILIVEFIGALGLFVLTIKFNKKLFAILLGVVLLWLFIIFSIAYIYSNMSIIF
jgi:hypothetical protein